MKRTKFIAENKAPWRPMPLEDRVRGPLGICSCSEFSELLRHERLRSDRLNKPLSLVAFSVRSADASNMIARVLLYRGRQTDLIGWLDGKRLGVLLRATDSQGAISLVESLLRELSYETLRNVDIEISTYPKTPTDNAAPQWTASHSIKGVHTNGYSTSRLHSPVGVGRPVYDNSVVSLRLDSGDLEPVFCRTTPRWKRMLDVMGASCGLVVCAPLFAVVAIFIKLVSSGPVFFVQPRVGYGGREFRFIKFRTMGANNDQSVHSKHATDFIRSNGSMAKLDEADPRIIPGGRLLRVTAIDELPQLYNVLRGDMSLVGPRPCIPYEAAEYQRWHRHRFSILPGLTGLWQVSGKNKLSFAEMIRLDIRYERTMSLSMDLSIILRTFPTVVGLFVEAVVRRVRRTVIPTSSQSHRSSESQPSS